MSETATSGPELEALRAAGAAQVDAVGWHYIETLAQRMHAQSGPAQRLLQTKLQAALMRLQTRMTATTEPLVRPAAMPSPLATLLQDMGSNNSPHGGDTPPGWPADHPRIQQFKKQLGQLRVHKQVTQAIAQAPQNAGPINSHMLVLRSLGLMRDISPDYLNRFMAHVDTLLCLDEADKGKLTPKKAATAAKTRA